MGLDTKWSLELSLIFLRGSERVSCLLAGDDFRARARVSLVLLSLKKKKPGLF